jgi:hypothetical protein
MKLWLRWSLVLCGLLAGLPGRDDAALLGAQGPAAPATPASEMMAVTSKDGTRAVVVLERQAHNAKDAGRDALANAIISFAANQR